MRALLLTLTTCLLVLPAHAKYSGGTGEPNDPYQIATADDLIALGETPEDYDKHFILTADIDLDPNFPGRKVFDKAVISPDTDPNDQYFQGRSFTGVFDGNSHTISHLTIKGKGYLGLFGSLEGGTRACEVRDLGVVDVNIAGSGHNIGGLVGSNWGTVTQCYSTGVVSGDDSVGGLVGYNHGGLSQSYSQTLVNGNERVGGLAGINAADLTGMGGCVTNCYSTCMVSGHDYVGGLVGYNYDASVWRCYSTAAVRGWWVGGLVGINTGDGMAPGEIEASFWDTQTSGVTWGMDGTGKTTAEMQRAKTFLDSGWDFAGETANGTEDIWWIDEGKDYPRLWWELIPEN